MKTELTQELKCQFFAQYWNQRVVAAIDSTNEYLSRCDPDYAKTEGFYLLLRSKQSLTDGELLRVSAFLDISPEYKTAAHMRKIISMSNAWGNTSITRQNHLHIRDELVSMGFAVEFMGHSVDSLVAAGWVKLIDKPENV